SQQFIDLQYGAFDRVVDVVGDVGRAADIDLAGGEEDVDANVDQKAALDLARDQAADDVALLVLGDDVLPLLLAFGLAERQDDGAGLVLDGVEQDLDLVAGLGRLDGVDGLVVPLLERDDTLALVADVNHHVVADDAGDAAMDDLVQFELRMLEVQVIQVEVVARLGVLQTRGQFLLKVLFGHFKLAEQVTIDHAEKHPLPLSG